jgi:hypothetical protein
MGQRRVANGWIVAAIDAAVVGEGTTSIRASPVLPYLTVNVQEPVSSFRWCSMVGHKRACSKPAIRSCDA